MSGTCKNCERRFTDFGGCRCQAFLVTGNASATDPVCSLSPDHDLIKIAQSQAGRESERLSLYYRTQER
jgi:pyrroloquinoline quinone biosynthesis protein E